LHSIRNEFLQGAAWMSMNENDNIEKIGVKSLISDYLPYQSYNLLWTQADPMQQAAIRANKEKLLLIRAGPGSGKSMTLMGRILHLLDEGIAPERIVLLMYGNEDAKRFKKDLMQKTKLTLPFVSTIHAYAVFLQKCFLRSNAQHGDVIGEKDFADRVMQAVEKNDPKIDDVTRIEIISSIPEDELPKDLESWLINRSIGRCHADYVRVADQLLEQHGVCIQDVSTQRKKKYLGYH